MKLMYVWSSSSHSIIFGKVYYLTQLLHGIKQFRFGFRFFYFTTDILNVNPDVFTLLSSREYLENESMDAESET